MLIVLNSEYPNDRGLETCMKLAKYRNKQNRKMKTKNLMLHFASCRESKLKFASGGHNNYYTLLVVQLYNTTCNFLKKKS